MLSTDDMIFERAAEAEVLEVEQAAIERRRRLIDVTRRAFVMYEDSKYELVDNICEGAPKWICRWLAAITKTASSRVSTR